MREMHKSGTIILLVMLLWSGLASAQMAPLGPEEYRFVYVPYERGSQDPVAEYRHARQMGYRYIGTGDPTGAMSGFKNIPEAAGMRLIWGDPEKRAGAESTSAPQFGFKQRVNTATPQTGADRTFIETYACWKNTSAFPNNIASTWWFSSTLFAMQPDFQQQEVITAVINALLAGFANSINPGVDFLFGGTAYDDTGALGRGLFYASPGISGDIADQTGVDSCVNHSGQHGTPNWGAYEFATYSDGMAAYHKQLWQAIRNAYPKARIYVEPYYIYSYFIDEIDGRADAQQLLPADMMVLQEATGNYFVEDSRNFVLGLTKDRVGIVDPYSCSEASQRAYIGASASNGAWMPFHGTFGIACTDYQGIAQVPARIQLAKVVSGWDNLMSVPLASRSWNGSVYSSTNSYVSVNVMASRHPVTRKLFTVFHNKTEGIPIASTETIANAKCTSTIFVETGGDCTNHFQVVNSKITMTGSGTVGVGYIITLNTATPPPSGLYPNQPAGFVPFAEFNFSTLTQTGVSYPVVTDTGSQYRTSIISDPTAPKSPSSVIQDIWDDPANTGGGAHYVEPVPAFQEAYASVWMKISDPYVPYAACLEKGFKWNYLPGGLSGAIWFQLICAPEFNGDMDLQVGLTFSIPDNLLNNCHLPGLSASDCPGTAIIRGTPGFADPTLSKGVWHRIETYYKNSTCGTCQNGIVRVWLDGNQTHELTAVNTYQGSMLQFWMGQAWSAGAGPGPKAHYFDHVYLSAPLGSPPPQPIPPSAPTGITIQ